MKIKCISLWQPWASAIAVGLKKIETRSWRTHYFGPLAIHAAKRWEADEKDWLVDFHFDFPNESKLLPAPFPLGKIVCIANLCGCVRTEDTDLSALEIALGNYTPGRWAWVLKDIVPLKEPIPWRGSQGFFDVELSEGTT